MYQAGTAFVQVLPSTRGFQTRLKTELSGVQRGGFGVPVKPEFDNAAAQAKATAVAKSMGRKVNFKVDLDKNSLSSSIIGVAALSRALRTIAVPAGLVAATPYVLSLAASLAQAAGAGALLPAVLVAGGVAAGTLIVGLSGVADTFKELAKEDAASAVTAAASGKAREAALRAVRSAQTALEDAQRSSLRRVEAAEDDLARAQEDARRAQEALTLSRKAAREELRQLQFSIESAALSEEEAADRLEEARARLVTARAGGAGAEEISDLDREVRRADLDLWEASHRYATLRAEGEEWARTGIEGSRRVTEAQRQVAEANQGVAAAELALTRSRADGAREVEQATLALAEAQAAVGEAGAAAGIKSAAAMAALSPAARALVGEVRALGPAWTAMRLDVQERLLAGIGVRVGQLGRNYIPILNGALGITADGFNRAARDSLDFLNTAGATADVRAGLDGVSWGINNASGAMQPLLRSFLDFFVVGSTFLPGMGASITGLAERFAHFTARARETGQMRQWIQGGIDTLKQMWRVVWNLGSIFTSVFKNANASGYSFLSTIERVTGRVAAALKTPEGAAELRDFFTGVREIVGVVVDKLVQLWPVIAAGGAAFGALLVAASPLSSVLFGMVTTALVPMLNVIGWMAPVLGPLIVAFFTIYTATKLWAAATMAATAVSAAFRLATGLQTGATIAQTAAMKASTVATNIGRVAGMAWNAVMLTGRGIQLLFTASTWARVASFLAVAAITTAATVAQWGWNAAVAVGRGAILVATAAQWAWNAAMLANPIGVVIVAIAALVAAVVYAWQNFEWFRNIVMAAWAGIQAVSVWVWHNALKPVFDAFGAAITWVGNNWSWLSTVLLIIIGPIGWVILAFTKFRDEITAAIKWVGSVIWGTFDWIIRAAFNPLVGGLNWVGDNFDRVVNWIGDIWNRLRGLLAKPINFMIGTVWNGGILQAWNAVAWLLPGVDPIKPLNLIPEFASGGVIPGTGNKDNQLLLGTPGEFVIRKEIAQPTRRFLAALNAGQPEAIQAAGGRGARPPSLLSVPIPAYAGGGPIERGIDFARAQHRKPYIWAGVGPTGYDCSGFMSAIANVLMGRYPHSRIGSTGTAPWPGWARGLTSAFGVGWFTGSPGHMAGTLAGNNVEAGGSPSMTKFVQQAAGAMNFSRHMSLPQVGGEFIGGPGGGGWIDFAEIIRSTFRRITDPLINLLPGTPPPEWNKIPRSLATWARDQIMEWAISLVGLGGAGGPVREVVQGVAARWGWGTGRQWADLDALISKESSWNPLAQNPRSTAFGLYQFLDSTWATVGGHKTSDPALQAEFGNRYIRQRYGDPIGAWAFHRRNNWYDDGGWVPPGWSTIYNGTGRREAMAVFNDRQWKALQGAVRGGDAAPVIGTLVQNIDGGDPQETFDRLHHGLRHYGGVHR